MSKAGVADVAALRRLRDAVGRFQSGVREVLAQVQREIARTGEWIRDREFHWRREVGRAQAMVEQAKAESADCRRRDRNCDAEEGALTRARGRLRAAEAELDTVLRWKTRIEEGLRDYRGPASRCRDLIARTCDQAQAFLDRRTEELEVYLETIPQTAETASTARVHQNGPYVPAPGTRLVGDPLGFKFAWRRQDRDAPTCAVVAQGAILIAFGHSFDEKAYVAEARRHGWFGEGTHPDDVGKLLELHGVPVDAKQGADFADLVETVDAGKGAIVGVNMRAINGQRTGHALWVTGLELDQETGDVLRVICNDSDRDDGAGYAYDTDTFLTAWHWANNVLVSTQAPMPRSKPI